ncbi:MAG: hypothetical protein ACREQ9_15820, partial [Candidatus Binatia bacterium]
MPKNLPAKLPVRPNAVATIAVPRAVPSAPMPSGALGPPPGPLQRFPALGMTLDRRALSRALRFASRLTATSPIPALGCCLFEDGAIVATDLDVSLRARIDGARDLKVLVPVQLLKQCLSGRSEPTAEIHLLPPTPDRTFPVSVDGALLLCHDPAEFPDPSKLFPRG